MPRLHRLASQVIQEWCDEVLFATFKVFTKQTDEGFDRKRTQGIGTGERILRTVERPAHVAKNRLSLPEELPLDWNAYAQHMTPAPPTCRQSSKTKERSSMANLNGFDANNVDPATDFEPMPAGKYLAVITESRDEADQERKRPLPGAHLPGDRRALQEPPALVAAEPGQPEPPGGPDRPGRAVGDLPRGRA